MKLIPTYLIDIGFNKFFFLSEFSFTDTDDSQDSRGREGPIFYSTLPLSPAHEHSDIYLQLCMWDDYHIFLIATLVFTRLLLDEILPPYRITIWLIDEVKFVLVCLFEKYQLRRELPVTVPWVEIEYTHEKTNNICPRPPPNYIFFTNSIPLTFFDNIAPMIYWVNTKMRGSYLFMFIKQQGATFLSLK